MQPLGSSALNAFYTKKALLKKKTIFTRKEPIPNDSLQRLAPMK